ncbi:MAG: alpha/beta hydrolase, partial [Gammaproteobacteria bacterium]|nr:alpha/beta hydrolase [Gammaproteobacteria bacterium]
MKIRYIIAGLSLLFLSACSSTGLFILNSTLKLKSDHTVARNLQFGDAQWQQLDVYIPATESAGAKPVLVFFYGGSWDSGSKEMYYFVADAFVRLGYVVVIPDYVKYPRARFPMFIEDGAAAIAWTKFNIKDYGGDPDNIFVSGHSAGAHLGGLLLTDESYLEKYHLSPLDIKGFSGLAGPYNFTPTRPNLVEVFGPEENFPNMQTMNFVNGNEPPMLLLHGAGDNTVGVRNQEVLIEKLSEVGNTSRGVLY